ncbi:MAG: S8 family peptidase [Blastocatellia bacterium]
MSTTDRNIRKALSALLAVLLSLPGLLPPVTIQAQILRDFKTRSAARPHKIAADLDERVRQAGVTLSADENCRVIIRPDDLATETAVINRVAALGGRFNQSWRNIRLMAAELPLGRLRELEADSSVAWVSPDREVRPTGFIEVTTGAAKVRNQAGSVPLDGRGIGIAVIDSGIYTRHSAFARDSGSSVIASRDFTGENLTFDDPYGHGSHVATLAAGAAGFAGGAYTGIAPGANIINLRVLDENGTGLASRIIAALDWCIASRGTYNLRVINLSLGTAAAESYRTDPLCLAVRRAYNAGMTVVCAAGNLGRDAAGQKIYGGINSPGIDPAALTVGATNTFGTLARSDDRVTTYSSRGPTRGYYTDANGVKHYDNLLKPDLVAPGNRLIGAQSIDQNAPSQNNTLIRLNPQLDTGFVGSKTSRTMYLSGTSMAAPVVSGAAALLWQASPTLTPGLVKAILMYTAQPLAGFNTLEQGAGLLNIDGAVRVALLVRASPALLVNGASLLNGSLPLSQASVIAGETCWWGQAVITNYCFLYGSNLMRNWQGMYAPGVVLADATSVVNGTLQQNPGLVSKGVLSSSGVVVAGSRLMSDGVLIASGIVFADGLTWASGIVFADGRMIQDYSLLTDNVLNPPLSLIGDPARP